LPQVRRARTRTVRLIAEHAALRDAIGGAPSVHACYQFTVKLREYGDALAGCLDRVLAALRDVRRSARQSRSTGRICPHT
jgi:hypothetical protein